MVLIQTRWSSKKFLLVSILCRWNLNISEVQKSLAVLSRLMLLRKPICLKLLEWQKNWLISGVVRCMEFVQLMVLEMKNTRRKCQAETNIENWDRSSVRFRKMQNRKTLHQKMKKLDRNVLVRNKKLVFFPMTKRLSEGEQVSWCLVEMPSTLWKSQTLPISWMVAHQWTRTVVMKRSKGRWITLRGSTKWAILTKKCKQWKLIYEIHCINAI